MRNRVKSIVAQIQSSAFARNVFKLATGGGIAQLVGFLFAIPLAWIYTPVDFGQFAVVLVLGSFLGAIIPLRFDYALVLPESDAEARTLKWCSTIASFSLSVLAAFVLIITGPALEAIFRISGLRHWILASALLGFLTAEFATLGSWLSRKKDYVAIAQCTVVLTLGGGLAQLGLFFVLGDFRGLILGQLFGSLLAVIWIQVKTGSYLFTRQAGQRSSATNVVKRYIKMPFLSMPATLVSAASANALPLMIGSKNNAVLGQFNQAWKIMYVPTSLFLNSILKVFLQESAQTPPEKLFGLVKATVKRVALAALLPYVLLAVVVPPLFPVIFGPQWHEAGELARLLVPWMYMMVVTTPLSPIFIVTNTQGTYLIFTIITSAIPIVIMLFSTLNIATTLLIISLTMCLALGSLILLALHVARRYAVKAGSELVGE